MIFIDKKPSELKLMTNIADWMASHGEILSDWSRSSFYAFVRIRKIRWRGRVYDVIDVDNLTCQIERVE